MPDQRYPHPTAEGVPFRQFKTGARPTPKARIRAYPAYKGERAAPSQFAYLPGKLSMWGNDQYGDCVSAEEAFAKACYGPEIFIPDEVVISWARDHGVLNGATLDEVLTAMKSAGFQVEAQRYDDGAAKTVDYANEATLRLAISDPQTYGPVKIAIDSSALPREAGNRQGWSAFGGGRYTNTDHCVALSGYGPTDWLFSQLGVPRPSGSPDQGYHLYTWSTIGVVDHAWLMGTCVEAWIRTPTTIGVPPIPAPVPPGPGPGPEPPPGPGPGPEPPPWSPCIPRLRVVARRAGIDICALLKFLQSLLCAGDDRHTPRD